jgi:hypothetical protein
VTTKYWPKDVVKEAMASPKCKEQGYTNDFIKFGKQRPEITVGGATFKDCRTAFKVSGRSVITIREPQAENGPFSLTAFFHDKHGREALRIVDNEWFLKTTDRWDIVFTAGKMGIMSAADDVCLEMRIVLPNRIVFEKVDMYVDRIRIVADSDRFDVFKEGMLLMSLGHTEVHHADCGFSF